jgi:hypothetical protein
MVVEMLTAALVAFVAVVPVELILATITVVEALTA